MVAPVGRHLLRVGVDGHRARPAVGGEAGRHDKRGQRPIQALRVVDHGRRRVGREGAGRRHLAKGGHVVHDRLQTGRQAVGDAALEGAKNSAQLRNLHRLRVGRALGEDGPGQARQDDRGRHARANCHLGRLPHLAYQSTERAREEGEAGQQGGQHGAEVDVGRLGRVQVLYDGVDLERGCGGGEVGGQVPGVEEVVDGCGAASAIMQSRETRPHEP